MFVRIPRFLTITTLALLTAHSASSITFQEPRRVALFVTVTDKSGEYVRGLTRDSFAIFENDQPREIIGFENGDLPTAIGIVFDLSGSINPKSARASQLALTKLVEFRHPETTFFLAGISSQPQLFRDWTRSESDLIAALPPIPPKKKLQGYTAFYDACYLSVEKLMGSTYTKRVLIVLSDGADNNSKHTFQELKRLLESTGVLFYAVSAVADESEIPSSLREEGRGILDELSSATGGRVYFPKQEADIDKALTRISQELQNQYSITIEPDASRLKSKHPRLKVKLNLPLKSALEQRTLGVRNRQHYYVD